MATKIFLDASILLDELFDDRKHSKNTQKVIDRYLDLEVTFVVSSSSIPLLHHAGRDSDLEKMTKFILSTLEDSLLFEVYTIGSKETIATLELVEKGCDFASATNYIVAKHSGCKAIITNDENFPQLDLPLVRTAPDLREFTPTSSQS